MNGSKLIATNYCFSHLFYHVHSLYLYSFVFIFIQFLTKITKAFIWNELISAKVCLTIKNSIAIKYIHIYYHLLYIVSVIFWKASLKLLKYESVSVSVSFHFVRCTSYIFIWRALDFRRKLTYFRWIDDFNAY